MNYWIFQGNPDAYKFDSSIESDLLNEWNVKAHFNKIKKGDKAIIWITGEKSGCYGLVDILTNPAFSGESEDHDLWNPDNEIGKKHQDEDANTRKVRIKFTHRLFDKPILKNSIPATNGLLEKLKGGIRGTNFTSSQDEFETILNIIEPS